MVCACYGCPRQLSSADEAQVLVLDADEPTRRARDGPVHRGLQDIGSEAHPGSPERPLTPRQLYLQDWLQLPATDSLPVLPDCSLDEPLEVREGKLRGVYKDFAIDFHTGVCMTLLKSATEYCDTHCQLMDDMVTLKLDQRNGRIIEFPLRSVTKVYQMVKLGGECAGPRLDGAAAPPGSEEVVVLEFVRRKYFKLAFVFPGAHDAQRFQICMGLLVRRAKQMGPIGFGGSDHTLLVDPGNDIILLECALDFTPLQQPKHTPCAMCASQQ